MENNLLSYRQMNEMQIIFFRAHISSGVNKVTRKTTCDELHVTSYKVISAHT